MNGAMEFTVTPSVAHYAIGGVKVTEDAFWEEWERRYNKPPSGRTTPVCKVVGCATKAEPFNLEFRHGFQTILNYPLLVCAEHATQFTPHWTDGDTTVWGRPDVIITRPPD